MYCFVQELVPAGARSHGTRLRQKGHVESLMNPALGAFLFPIFHYEITAPTLSSNLCLERVEKHQPSPFANHLRIPSITTNQRICPSDINQSIFSPAANLRNTIALYTIYSIRFSITKLLFPIYLFTIDITHLCASRISRILLPSARSTAASPGPLHLSTPKRIHSYRILPRNQTGPHGRSTRLLGRLNMR